MWHRRASLNAVKYLYVAYFLPSVDFSYDNHDLSDLMVFHSHIVGFFWHVAHHNEVYDYFYKNIKLKKNSKNISKEIYPFGVPLPPSRGVELLRELPLAHASAAFCQSKFSAACEEE